MRNRLVALATLLGMLVASTSWAGHHLWDFTEIFSSADGTVQFAEMFTADNNEQGVGPFTVTASGHTLNFVTNLPTSATAATWILIGTSNISTMTGGCTPDYIIPANFFSTSGGTFNYASGTDVWAYGTVPTDGVHSLLRNGSTAVNSPRNFAGQGNTLFVSVPVPMMPTWGIVLLVGALLLAASGLLRRRKEDTLVA